MTTIDNFDHRILELLQSDGRMTITDLSDQIGLSRTPCLKRVQKLETAGYIKKILQAFEQGNANNIGRY